MADKINMSLDDIIKHGQKKVKSELVSGTSSNNRKTGSNNGRVFIKPGKNNRRVPPVKNSRIAMANKVLKKSKAIAARRAAGVGSQRRVFTARGKPTVATGLSAVATKKLVNKLVNNALRKRTNITTTQVVRKRGGVAASTIASRRNLAIKRNVTTARVIGQPVRTVIQQRPVVAPVRTIVQHVQPPVKVIRKIITAPHTETQVIRSGPSEQSRRNHPQRQRRTVIQPVRQTNRFRSSNNNHYQNQTSVIRRVVHQTPRRSISSRPQYEQVVQRVIEAPIQRFNQQPQRFQQQQRQRLQQQPKRFQRHQTQGGRNAGGRPARRNDAVRQNQQIQYRPVQYVTEQVVTSRGRGFRAY